MLPALLLVTTLAAAQPAVEPSPRPAAGVVEKVFGIRLTDTETKVVGILFACAFALITWATRSGRKADQETKAKTTTEREDTKDMSMRDLVVETFRSALSAEASAADAKKAGVDLAAKIDTNHGEVKGEIARLDGAIKETRDIAVRAEQMARAASGKRASDEALRETAAATPPTSLQAVTEG